VSDGSEESAGDLGVGIGRSIRARLVFATSALIILVTGSVIAAWVLTGRAQMDRVTRHNARSLTSALAGAWGNELSDQNWNQVRIQVQHVIASADEFVYLIVTDEREGGRIVAATPLELVGAYVPDVVPLHVSEAARGSGTTRESETFLLRDVEFPAGQVRGRRGQRVLEVATDIELGHERVGVLRLGVSLEPLDTAMDDVLKRGLSLGGLFLVLGVLGAWIVGRRLTRPLTELTSSTSRMAAGDLAHRASVVGTDEIGALASAFNRMATALEGTITTLRATARAFERFVPNKFLGVVAPEGIAKIKVGTHATRAMTILFCDIRGYTKLSEGSTDEQMFHFLNEYLPEMGAAIEAHGGFVDKYIGDAIMALFDDEHADGALDAALAMRRRLHGLNARWLAEGREQIEIGVGLHRGTVVMGTVGYSSRIDSTVIGDAVNLASRIEGLTKKYGCEILLSGAVVDTLSGADGYALRVVDEEVRVRGKAEAVVLHALEDKETPRVSMVPG